MSLHTLLRTTRTTTRTFSASTAGIPFSLQRTTNSANLPRLPIPSLEDTASRYLTSIEPLVGGIDTKEYRNQEALVSDFLASSGAGLHEKLVDLDQKPGYPFSYSERWWDDMYLEGRWALPINGNPFYVIQGSDVTDSPGSTTQTSRLLSSMLRWHMKVLNDNLELDGGCLSAYPITFGTGRVAKVGRDVLSVNPNSKHVVVIHRNVFYTVQAVDEKSGKVYAGEVFEAAFDEIMNSSVGDDQGNEFIGILTSLDRDVWAAHRSEIEIESKQNAANLHAIDSALFVVNLDTESIKDKHDESSVMLHGNAGRNRWFDKHQMTRMENGKIGLNFEHSFSDAMAWNRFLGEALEDVRGVKGIYSPLEQPAANPTSSIKPHHLTFSLPSTVQSAILQAHSTAALQCGNADSHMLDFSHFGKSETKKWKVSPDAAVQMAYQLAYGEMHGGERAGTYESCATRNFHRGRTEVIRSCTSESASFVDLMRSPSSSNDAKREAFHASCNMHISMAKAAKVGHGVDRHFMALELINSTFSPEVKKHELFKSEVFVKSKTWKLSTSNVSAPFLNRFGFGAVAGDGYGLGYLVQNDSIPINVTSYVDSEKTGSKGMAGKIEESLLSIQKLF